MDKLPNGVLTSYRDIANDPKYQHFVRIPDRILQCIDYFRIDCDREVTRSRLRAYYLFIGVVDDTIDSGRIDTGNLILEYLDTPAPKFDQGIDCSVRLVTEVLKAYICDRSYPVMMDKLRELYGEVVSERVASGMGSYIDHRNSVGALTAELSYLLIKPGLRSDSEALCEFMKQVGAVGCLIDSLIDLHKDRRLGLLGFQPRVRDYAKLSVSILRSGLRISLRHPRLYRLFFSAVLDNIQDPIIAEQSFTRIPLVSDRKDETASVA
jgi:hypothetical protein